MLLFHHLSRTQIFLFERPSLLPVCSHGGEQGVGGASRSEAPLRESRRLFEGVKAGDHNPKCHVAAAAANKNVLMPLMRRMGAAMGQLFSIGVVEKELLDKMWDALKYVF